MTSIAIIGAGPGLGAAVARRFGREGFDVALIARDHERTKAFAAELGREGVTARGFAADVRDPKALAAALDAVNATMGPVEVLQYSPVPQRDFMLPVLETTHADLTGPVEFSVYGPSSPYSRCSPVCAPWAAAPSSSSTAAPRSSPPRSRRHVHRLRRGERVRPSAARRSRRRGHPCRAADRPRRDHRRTPQEGPGRARGHPVGDPPGAARVPALRRRPRLLTAGR